MNQQTALHLAVERQHTQIVRVSRKCGQNFMKYIMVEDEGRIDVMDLLVSVF